MKKIFSILLILLVLSQVLQSQVSDTDKFIKTWRITDKFGGIDSIRVDTFHINFQELNPIDLYSISNSYNGNLGSPIQSKIYFNRPENKSFIFSNALYPYINQIETTTFYNTRSPFTSLKYLSGGTQYKEEEQIKFLFTANANKKMNFGTSLDYIYAHGEYADQAVKRFAGSFFGSFTGKHYSATGLFAYNNHSNFENGGITQISFITNPPRGTKSNNIPINITGYSNYKSTQLFYNQQYTLGIERVVAGSKDSTNKEYVPVTRFIHTFQYDDLRKRYFENSVESRFYKNTYYNLKQTNDTAAIQILTNRFSAGMAEEFNKWLRFGMTVYLENEIERFTFMKDTLMNHKLESNTKIGAVLSKEKGQMFRYNFSGEINMIGYRAGDINLQANVGGFFKLWKDSISMIVNGFIRSEEPSYFLQHYHSNHFKWENDFSKIYKTHLGGTFSIPTRSFSLNINVENISKQIYFDSNSLPSQFGGNVQILSANLKQDFHVKKFTLENNMVYQLSSHPEIVPLPTIVLFHNLYYHDKWFNVLSVQLGTSVRYHTSYLAPSYMPAIGQFYNQSEMKVGNYPVVNVYGNFHLKRTRFFVEYYHVNQLFMSGAYFSMPYYPVNPAVFKMGLTWNFYD
ncbi:MAG: putative porin [Paludibacter sp.]|nr:putative porin [Paludibacter sp.]